MGLPASNKERSNSVHSSFMFHKREGLKVENKKSVIIITLWVLTPLSVISHSLILFSFWPHKEQLWSKLFFPLEKVKILRIIMTLFFLL